MRKTVAAGLLVATALVASFGPAQPHSGASGVVKERMDAMKDIGARMKMVAAMIRKRQPFDADAARKAANGIAEHARSIPGLFPEGSLHGPSEALPAIWSDWDRFTRHARMLEARAESFASMAEAAQGPEELAAPFRQMAESCSACHESFRAAD